MMICASREVGLNIDINGLTRELDKICVKLDANYYYNPVQAYSDVKKTFLQGLGISMEQIIALTGFVNTRWHNPRFAASEQKLPPPRERKKRWRPRKPKVEDNKPKRPRGRPRKQVNASTTSGVSALPLSPFRKNWRRNMQNKPTKN